MSDFTFEVVARGQNEIGEGPVWVDDEQRLMWVDITRNLVQWFDPETGRVESLDVGRHVGAVAMTSSGYVVAAVVGGFASIVPSTGEVRMIAEVEADVSGNRMNDGKCDNAGRFWAGTMAYDRTPDAAALYRLDHDLSVAKMLAPVTLSNGIDWSPDDRLMYYVDSTTQRIDVFDFDAESGRMRNRRLLVDIPAQDGLPDGIAVDVDGGVWVAVWGAGTVRRFTSDGKADVVIQVPASQVTSCAFGGADYRDLYITSAATGLSAAERAAQPEAGSLFRCRPGHTGRPAHRFAGSQA